MTLKGMNTSHHLTDAQINDPTITLIRTAGLLAALLLFVALKFGFACKSYILPPGPKPLPLVGNLFDIPSSEEWLTWRSFIERYGDIVYLKALGRGYLLLGSPEAISDLLEKRPHFNDRPRSIMIDKILRYAWVTPWIAYGNAWRKHRKLMHLETHMGTVATYRLTQIYGARRFVGDLLAAEITRPADRTSESAKALLPHMIRAHFGLTAVHMIYGIDVREPEMKARFVDVPEAANHAASEAVTAGRFLVDYLPFLQYVPSWFPGAYFKRFGLQGAVFGQQSRDDPMKVLKAQMAAGTVPISMVAHMLQSGADDEELIKDVAASIFFAGSDTTVAAVTSYFLAAIKFPEMQRRVQEELDHVIGRGRFPDFSDKDHLPYLEAVMRECLRWLPVLPTGVAHKTSQDDYYRGYFIPKSTIVLPLQWQLMHDAERYPSPSVFSPERYLNRTSDGSWELRTDVEDPRKYAFGFGRRVCPGKHIAEQGLFASLSTVIHTLDITRARDTNGREIDPKARTNSGFLTHALPFPYEVQGRRDSEHLIDVCVAVALGKVTLESTVQV